MDEIETETRLVELLPDTGEPNSTVFALGATGSGKTTLMANELKERERFLIFDTRNEYQAQFFGSRFGECYTCNDFNTYINLLNQGKKRIIYDLSGITDFEQQEEALNVALLVLCEFQLANKELPPITVAMDELNKFTDTHHACGGIREIIQRGRGVKIQKIFGAQWFGTLPTWVRDTFTEMYVFRHTDKTGLTRLENYGFSQELLKELPMYHAAYLGKDGIKIINFKLRG